MWLVINTLPKLEICIPKSQKEMKGNETTKTITTLTRTGSITECKIRYGDQ